MFRPVIGISLSLENDNDRYSYAKYPWYALRAGYADAVSDNGGVPIMLPFDESAIDEVLTLIDGLIIPGGDDIDPAFYGQKILSDTVEINHKRTEYDFKLMKKALEIDMPVFGICYGMQLLNVLFGGTLVQDLPTFKPTSISHAHSQPRDTQWHEVNIVSGTKLHDINLLSKGLNVVVNSHHHQAIDTLGEGIMVSAVAPDGIIEAIESTKHNFAVGVEWHPEYQNTALDRQLFKTFINVAEDWSSRF